MITVDFLIKSNQIQFNEFMHKQHNTIKLVSSQHKNKSNVSRGQSQHKQKSQHHQIQMQSTITHDQQIYQQPNRINRGSINARTNTPSYSDINNTHTHQNLSSRITELQLQLNQSQTQVHFLTQRNQQLLDKLMHYQAKCEDMKIMEQQLQFRREQQAHIQGHLDNYQNINNRLRERVVQLEALLKGGIGLGVGCAMTDTVTVPLINSNSRNSNYININNNNNNNNNSINNKLGSRSTYNETQSCEISREISRKSYLEDSKTEQTRKSIGQIHKQNHPLTPKSKVNINFEKLAMKEIESMHQIKERRRVFM